MIKLTNLAVVVDNVTLLAPVSVTVPDGGSLVIRGQNGAGKSTLLRVIAGVTGATAGVARVADGKQESVAAMIGLPPMAADLTVFDHLMLVTSTWYQEAQQAERVAENILERLNLAPLRSRFAHELSSGQTQLFALAMTLARPAEVIILDEPEQRLDLSNLRLVIDILNEKRRGGATLVVATHSDLLAAGIAGQTLELVNAS